MRSGFAPILLALLVTGCAISPTRVALTTELQQKFAERDRSLAALTHWSFTGRIAVQADNDGWSGTLQWLQNDQNYLIDIHGPVGTGTVRLERSAQGNVLRLSDEQSFAGPDVRALLIEHIGWDIPVDALQRWIIGRPDPGLDKQFELDDAGRLQHLHQSGWDVEYKRYARNGTFDLPEKIFARNERAQLRLFVDEWSTP